MTLWYTEKNDTIGGVLMKPNKYLLFFCFIVSPFSFICSQDRFPSSFAPEQKIANCDTLCCYSQRVDTVAVPVVHLPVNFQNCGANELIDSLGILNPFWEKLRLLHAGLRSDTIRIVHIGDSHIRGHFFPRAVGDFLVQSFGDISYVDRGINGAFCTTFTHPDRISQIVALHPDLLILSFGTNESHNRKYNRELHYREMGELVRMIRDRLPGVPLLMTTPPGSYESTRKRRRHRVYNINPRTVVAVSTILRFADDNGLAVWNLYNVAGGSRRACMNWQGAKLMRPDHIHYLAEGYLLQGELFYQALLKAYNHYVEY